jgi:hypothetical protein
VHGLPPERGSSAIWLLSAGLMVLLGVAVILTFMVLRAPPSGRFQVAQLEPISCPAGIHTPVCYQAPVTNIGNSASSMKCIITPGVGSQAMFTDNQGAYISPNTLRPGESFVMLIKVDAPSGVTVTQPSVACIGI